MKMDISFIPFENSLIYTIPKRIVNSGWLQHIPFAFFLVDMERPKLIVELGSFSGASYCAFCQAINTLGLETRSFAIDTWQGDSHAGVYGEDVLNELRMYHDPLYSKFSTLIQGSFDDSVGKFKNGSIDLLHIDGYHTYDAVKSDFYSWLPKMNDEGIVLFHDTNVHKGGFGVWKLWAELKGVYPCFEFLHGSGLGILYIGKNPPQWFQMIAATTGWRLCLFRMFFSLLGKRIDLLSKLKQ
jgi:O-antigen biosynthesis protein